MEENISVKPIKLSDVEKMVTSVKKNVGDTDVELSLEFILTAFFPTCWYNIQQALSKEHTLGYIEGFNEGKKQTKFVDSTVDDADCFCD